MKMYQVDAFSQSLFKGNSAAVLVTEEWLEDALMQNIALENNLAETAFVTIIDEHNYAIRWFTPSVEVDFCGHATLASSFVLFKFFTQAKNIYFHVKNLGVFTIEQHADGKISMDFPLRRAEKLTEYPALLNELIDVPFEEVYVNQQAFILLCASEDLVRKAKPNLAKISALANYQHKSTGITASDLDLTITSAATDYDYVARYFAPHKGIDEDPVTGSMHTGLAPLWAEKLAKNNLTAYQASARGGVLYCDIKAQQRIEISGYARLYMVAEIMLDASEQGQ